MPKGSYLLAPDQVWSSPTWAGMLVGAALRGCSVFAISPSLLNAPVDVNAAMSRSNEIFRRLEPYRQPHEALADSRVRQRLGAERRMGH